MINQRKHLLPVLLSIAHANVSSGYFAQVNNAHVEFAASGTASGVVVEAPAKDDLVASTPRLDAAAFEGVTVGTAAITPQILQLFEEWVLKHEKDYESLEEKSKRMLVWLENHVLIETHNSKSPKQSYTLGHNAFSDLSHEEFRRQMRLGEFAGEVVHNKKEFKFASFVDEIENDVKEDGDSLLRGKTSASEGVAEVERRQLTEVDDSHDWAGIGLVGPIRNQGICGACWAFSAIGAIETIMAIDKYSKMGSKPELGVAADLGLVTPLSEQNLIDCDTVYEKGCTGGLMTTTFEEEEVKKGICSESDYPYHQVQGTCSSDMCTPVEGSVVKDHVDIVPRKNNALKQALKVAPVTAAMVASSPMFQFYQKGVFNLDDCGAVTKQMADEDCKILYQGQDVCLPDINHGVLVVGYGTDPDVVSDVKGYFRVKNSWGDAWGEDGYFRLARPNEDSQDPMKNWGMCGILTLLSYPVME